MDKTGILRCWLKKKGKFCYVYFSLLVLFVGLLLSANKIIMTVLGEVRDTQFEMYASNAPAASSVEVEFLGGIKEEVKISGWAFCDTTEEASGEKEIQLLLKSAKNCYVVPTTLGRRADVYEAFRETHNIVGMGHGFTAQFSTVGIKNGVYEVLVYCKENNHVFGLANPDIQIKKANKDVAFYTQNEPISSIFASQVINGDFFQMIDQYRGISSFIDQIEMQDAVISISGWAFLEGCNSEEQIVYIKLTNEAGNELYFTTQKTLRSDVGNYYNNPNYNMSGFVAGILNSDMPDGEYSLQVIVWIDEKIYGYAQYSIQKEENEIHYSS